MSDASSPDNLGSALFLSHATILEKLTIEECVFCWNEEFSQEDRNEWIATAKDFCKYLKEAAFEG